MTIKEVVAAIIVKEKQVFIARRADNQSLAGFWEFPGGKIEPSESPESCLQRELREELDIDCVVGDFFAANIYTSAQGTIKLMTYFVTTLSKDFRLLVHDKCCWVDINPHLLSYNFAPADVPIVEKLIDRFPRLK